jgi:4-amino-4-deoxychorismate lyase
LLINGEPSAHISTSDRGLQYGDGLFETIAVVDSRPCLWERHYNRLNAGGSRLGIDIPSSQTLLHEIQQVIASNEQGVIKIIITRGEGSRGYTPTTDSTATRIVQFSSWPDHSNNLASDGVRVRICNTKLGTNQTLAGIKHLNRLEQVMARAEWSDPEIKEGLMLNARGQVIEGTMSNIFMFKDNILHTPDLKECGVEGVMRSLVLDVAQELGVEVKIDHIPLSEALHADSLMLTNSLIGIWPVKRLEEREYNLNHLNQELISTVMSRAYVQ